MVGLQSASFWTTHWFNDTPCSPASTTSRACSDGEVRTVKLPL